LWRLLLLALGGPVSDHALAVLGLVTGVVFGLAALVSGFYLYRKGLERIDIRYLLGYETLFDGRAFEPPLVVTYGAARGASILRRCSVALWNVGRRTVRARDIDDSDPLRVEIPSSVIVGTLKRASVRSPVDISAKKVSNHSVLLTFKFLDQGDGGIIDIIYTGPDDAVPELRGTIEGLPKGVVTAGQLMEVQGKPAKPRWQPRVSYLVWLTRVVLFFLALVVVLILLPDGPIKTVLGNFAGYFFIGSYLFFIYLYLRDRPRSVPRPLWRSMVTSYSRFSADKPKASALVKEILRSALYIRLDK
jgi:hypothetical protein